jgi:hypothetical protein
MMDSPSKSLIEICRRLSAAAATGQLEWSAAQETVFLWTGKGGSISVRSRDGDGEEPYEVDIFNAAGQKVDTFSSEWVGKEQEPAAWNDPMARLYRAARRQALGVDQILKDLLAELPQASEKAASTSTR